MDHGSKNMDQRSSIMDQGQGPWTLDLAMNAHPGRDTDVRSRPSESIIKDLSFYIGFIKIQSSIKHFGPCLGMNGHSRRDPDMISRPSESTIKDLSFYIGFMKIQSSNKHVGPCFGTNGQTGSGHDIKTDQYYNSSPISFYRF